MSFQIKVEPSGRQFSVDEAEVILSAGIRQGIGMPYGCKDGACGSCKCKVLSGEFTLGSHQAKALSAQEESEGYILTCCATAQSDMVLESKQVVEEGAFPVKKMPVRVFSLTQKTDDVMILKLQVPAADLIQYKAGQYVDFLLRDGSKRSYSMANAPHTVTPESPYIELHLRHMKGGVFTEHVFNTMKEKEIQRIEGPQGSFFLRRSEKPMIFLASGTGFAPIKALLEEMMESGNKRLVHFYWGARRPHDLYLNDWVLEATKLMPNLHYVPVVSDATLDDAWTGRTGFVHLSVLQDLPQLSNYQVYACGAPIVIESARADFSKHGLAEEEFFADSFTSALDKVQV
jgi:CDP-4-dehydro-6-deoxyglucose reductase